MDAVIYSSHGRYLAPVNRTLGEGLVDEMIEGGKEQLLMRNRQPCQLFRI